MHLAGMRLNVRRPVFLQMSQQVATDGEGKLDQKPDQTVVLHEEYNDVKKYRPTT